MLAGTSIYLSRTLADKCSVYVL